MSDLPPIAGLSLANSLSPMLQFLPDALANTHARRRLMDLAAALPSVHCALLECRFDNADVVDLSLGVLNDPAESHAVITSLRRMSTKHPGWTRVLGFVQDWRQPTRQDDHIWLEFDLDTPDLTPPSVFLSTKGGAISHALDRLGTDTASQARAWLPRLPATASLDFVGVMVPRPESSVRLNVSGLTGSDAWEWLRSYDVRLPDSCKQDFMAVFTSGSVTMAVEAQGDQLGPRIGLECRPRNETERQTLFELCVLRGWSSKAALSVADTWPGTTSPMTGIGFPPELILQAVLSDQNSPVRLVRHINHLKVAFDTNGATSAKVYLGYTHQRFGD